MIPWKPRGFDLEPLAFVSSAQGKNVLSMLGKLLVGGCGFVEAVGTWRKCVCLQHLF